MNAYNTTICVGKYRLASRVVMGAIYFLVALLIGMEGATADTYVEQTNSAIEQLTRSIEFINAGDADQAQQAFGDASNSVRELRKASARALDLANKQHDTCLNRVVALSIRVGDIFQQEVALRKKIDELDATLAKATEDQKITRDEIDSLRSHLNNAAASLRVRDEKLKELSQWFWVPGYGQYLAIRTLIDDDIGQYNSLSNTLKDTELRLRHNKETLIQVETLKTAMLNEKENLAKTSSGLSKMREELDRRLSDMKAVVVFLTSGGVFWQKMGNLLDITVKGHETDLKLLYESLGRNIARLPFFKGEVGATTTTFKEALLELAAALDADKPFLPAETDSYCPAGW
ncbi:hypothetical protein [Methylogaea oryzae]|uniref:Uncharacterized protein n=1 Tax=Methylogaea oryzae TaxID=1295382 RepID=A0A8D5AKL4_9GAMM|nr:hypothetical protein [Methylogaea oryzae]BBL71266.1 hypothetical protein MoryE10_18720 [Methylogaea oryzae]